MASGAWHYKQAEALLKAADVTSDRALANPIATASAAVWGAILAAQVGGAQAHAALALVAAQVDANDLGTWSNDRGAGQTEWGKAVTGS